MTPNDYNSVSSALNGNACQFLPEMIDNSVADDNSVALPMVDDEQRAGFTIYWIPLAIAGVLIFLLWGRIDWTYILCLAIVVAIHELGHVLMGMKFGCSIESMHVFFFPFLGYRHRGANGHVTNWCLGVLPLGGATMFRSRMLEDDVDSPVDGSPYIDDKTPVQRLLISTAGALFNLFTFVMLFALSLVLPVDVLSQWSANVLGCVMWLSLILAVFNLLPVFPLDGGAIILSAFEAVTGRTVPSNVRGVLGAVGAIVVIVFFNFYTDWMDPFFNTILKCVAAVI